MPTTDPKRLLQAAKTSISLVGILHETLWQLFPNELLIFMEGDEDKIAAALCLAISQDEPDPCTSPGDTSDYFAS